MRFMALTSASDDNRPAVTNARFAPLHGLPVGPVPFSTAPVPLRKIAHSSRAAFAPEPQKAGASVGSLARRSVTSLLRNSLPCGNASLPSPTSQPGRSTVTSGVCSWFASPQCAQGIPATVLERFHAGLDFQHWIANGRQTVGLVRLREQFGFHDPGPVRKGKKFHRLARVSAGIGFHLSRTVLSRLHGRMMPPPFRRTVRHPNPADG